MGSACIKTPEFKLFDKDKAKFDGITCSGNCFILKGHLKDTPYLNNLSGVELKFYYRKTHGWFSSYLGKAYTDAGGNYQFKFDATDYLNPKDGYFSIVSYKEGYMTYLISKNLMPSYFHLDSTHINLPFTQNCTVVKIANIKVNIKANTQVNFKTLKFSYHYGRGIINLWHNGPGPYEKSFSIETAEGLPTKIEWNVTGNNTSAKGQDTIVVLPNTEPVYDIEF